jgi:PPK2 family polyphosphate:nucleotide phosphotransferase
MTATVLTGRSLGPVSRALIVEPGDDRFVLTGRAADDASRTGGRREAERALLGKLADRLDAAHDRLMAAGDHSVLIVLQGLDGSGKSGTIKHVGRLLNPVGVQVAAFKQPDPQEQAEHFLDRIRRQLPDVGQVAFFDRSHYEDVIVPRVAGELDSDAVSERLVEIEAFERQLVEDGTAVLKCVLHLSYEEQRQRFLRRLRRADKQWKFSDDDLETRRHWDAYQAAYGDAVRKSSFDVAPWFVVPADHKWYRNWAVASLLVECLEALGDEYPSYDGDAASMRAALEV